MQQQNNQKIFFKLPNLARGILNSGGSHKSFWELFEPGDSDGEKSKQNGKWKNFLW